MGEVYAAAFPKGRAWSPLELAELIGGPGGFEVSVDAGFAIGRAIAGEAELITIAVDPARQGRGAGRVLLAAFEDTARRRGAVSAFLEVAADNAAGLALYRSAGWQESGCRRGYYPRTGADPVDAILMTKPLG
ncbi:GNAT family N-acetyltransferase [Maritimibacter sp. UBA3975]|nr:GNAT family N-acetyltransferase [Maritimibacter sp. UBA3975]MAM60422.1 30S ribosomal protein S18 alanine N-acetyltransferase [Maritimibacter sp.]|tara:strand:- start:28538 stop:28936 length:399 start_codon:yes stop_codon:yes gene_type:complete